MLIHKSAFYVSKIPNLDVIMETLFLLELKEQAGSAPGISSHSAPKQQPTHPDSTNMIYKSFHGGFEINALSTKIIQVGCFPRALLSMLLKDNHIR